MTSQKGIEEVYMIRIFYGSHPDRSPMHLLDLLHFNFY
jgi:hypothetical protein